MGFAAGFQVGAQAVERGIKMREEDALKQSLAQEAGRYGVTEGAYGPGLQENIQQLQSLREQDPTQAPAYDQAIAELTRRQGLTAPDFSVASGPTNFATRQEARQAAAPLRTEGLAGVYRQYGDIAKADELEARAFEQQRAIAREARDVERAGRESQEFATRQTETGLRINQLTRTDAEQQRETDFSSYAAENPDMSVKDLKEAAFKQFKFSPAQWQKVVTTRLGIENAEMDSFKNNVRKKLQGKNINQVGELYNTDPDFDDKTDLAIVPGKGGAVTLNFIDKATKTVKESQTFKNQAIALEYLNKQATEPETIGSWMMNLRKTESAIDAQGAAAEASRATVGLRGAQAKQLKESAENATARADLVEKFEALTPEEQAGAKGQGLIKQFNLLNVKAGGTVPLGAAPKAAGPVRMDDVDKENLRAYREWEKDPRNNRLPQGEKDAYAARLGVTQFLNRNTAGGQTGVSLGGDAYAKDREAPPPAAAPKQGLTKTVAPPALSTENTKLLGRAGSSGYNVQMPDGTTKVLSISELNELGYQFVGGNTGLPRPWYADLLPRR
jgi:hypothetical protein